MVKLHIERGQITSSDIHLLKVTARVDELEASGTQGIHLGVDSSILFNHGSFQKPAVSPFFFGGGAGFLKRRIPGKNGEGTPRIYGVLPSQVLVMGVLFGCSGAGLPGSLITYQGDPSICPNRTPMVLVFPSLAPFRPICVSRWVFSVGLMFHGRI